MRLSNGEVLLHWPLDIHVLTQGWYYNALDAEDSKTDEPTEDSETVS